MYRTLIFGVAAALMLAGKVSAQSTLPAGGETSLKSISTKTSFYGQLSPGNRKIADALFRAQRAGDGGDGGTSWTTEDIALAKQQGTGWGNVFKRMKADGLVGEKNLGQIISGRGMTEPGGFKSGAAQTQTARYVGPVRANVIVTTADGRRVIYGLSKPGQRAKAFAKEKNGPAAGNIEKTAAWVGAKAVKSNAARTQARTSRPTVSQTARRAVVATRQSARLGRIARGVGRKARNAK